MARKTYTPDYRAHLVALVGEGRTPEQLSREYEPTAATIRKWVREAAAAGRDPSFDKDQRLRELEAEVAKLREERDILKKAAAWFASESVSTPKRGSRS